MAFKPHWRVSCIGTLGGGIYAEEFSYGFALAPVDGNVVLPQLLSPNDGYWADLAGDISAFHGRVASEIHPSAVLTMVKVARIGADGKYTASPVEVPVNTPGGAGGGRLPNQCATVVTLKTNGDLGRVKGRFYLPIPGMTLDANGMMGEAAAESIEGSAKTLLDDVNNAPGIDVLGLAVVVASQGRFNKDGSQRVAPNNFLVQSIAVGRVVDTQRRRRNSLREEKDYRALANPA